MDCILVTPVAARAHPMASSNHRRILAIVETDRTFERHEVRGRQVWLGKCLHCNSHLAVSLEGEPISRATVEHILPRTAGGDDALENLGLACARCNAQKGVRIDRLPTSHPKFVAMVERLRERRRKRWREPPGGAGDKSAE